MQANFNRKNSKTNPLKKLDWNVSDEPLNESGTVWVTAPVDLPFSVGGTLYQAASLMFHCFIGQM